MIISEKQIMQLILGLHDLIRTVWDVDNIHPEGKIKIYIHLLQEIVDQQSSEFKKVE